MNSIDNWILKSICKEISTVKICVCFIVDIVQENIAKEHLCCMPLYIPEGG